MCCVCMNSMQHEPKVCKIPFSLLLAHSTVHVCLGIAINVSGISDGLSQTFIIMR